MQPRDPRRHRPHYRHLAAAAAWIALGGCHGGAPPVPAPPSPVPTPALAAEVVFKDVAHDVGLDFVHVIGASGEYYLPEIMGSGCALLDYDNDGDLDVFLVQSGRLGSGKTLAESLFPPPAGWRAGSRLYRNDLTVTADGSRQLRFVDVSEAAGLKDSGYGMGAAVGDYDGDGRLDLYVTSFGANVLYHNNGDGTFTDVTAAAGVGDARWGTSASFLDYDRDGRLDLFVANYVAATLGNNKVCAPFGHRDYCHPNDFPRDTSILYHNLGGGRFADVSHETGIDAASGNGLGVIAADLDGDGWVDIYVANDSTPNHLWLNRGGKRFDEVALMRGAAVSSTGMSQAGMGITATDFDRDGDLDLFLTHLRNEYDTFYRNSGNGTFEDATFDLGLGFPGLPTTGFGTAFFDYDNDGYEDLFEANGAVFIPEDADPADRYPYAQRNQLFHNESGHGFREILAAPTGDALSLVEVSRGAAFGDVDNDGDVDVLVSNNNGPARLLLNQVGSRQHWLSIALRKAQGNRFGVGATITVVTASGAKLSRVMRSDGSYLSASDLRVHVGLGSDGAVAAVEVRWPEGGGERWENVAIDRRIVLQAGEGQALESR